MLTVCAELFKVEVPVFQAKNTFFKAKFTQIKELLLFHNESALTETLSAVDTEVKKHQNTSSKPLTEVPHSNKFLYFLKSFFSFLVRVGKNQTVDTESIFVIFIYFFLAC